MKLPLSAVLTPFLLAACMAFSMPADVIPPAGDGMRRSLAGDWSFRYIKGHEAGDDAGFFEPDFDAGGWKSIAVPSNWELKGFAKPHYALELKDGLGLYRRDFEVPAAWTGGNERVFLRFEGVAYGFEAWINGRKVGKSTASAYNPHTFDVTDAVKRGGGNVIAVKVATRPLGYEFDINDDWSLSGIFRDVSLFSVPATRLSDITTATKLTDDGAKLTVTAEVTGTGGKMSGTLTAPDGSPAGELVFEQASGESHTTHTGRLAIPRPRLWTAETPSLYQLRLTLSEAGETIQETNTRIGLREVSIADGVLLLNKRPIKLRGVNHHDLSPVHGRAMTVEEMRQDLELMKQANINFVRTSHYPPDQRLIGLCDEMGFYVMDEVSIGKGEEHLNNPKYRDNILGRVAPTIARDKNHASVLIWSIGNENPVTKVEMEAARIAKDLDPGRPVCIPKIGSYFEKNHERIPEFVDIFSPHYPVNTTLKRYARKLDRPVILTEYAHALGLATDRIQDQWDILQSTPTFAGGAIWHFHDQGLLRKAHKPVDLSKPTPYVWTGSEHYHDTAGDQGADGIVYSDRTPQSDFWQVRKVYAPVQIAERSATVEPGDRTVSLTVENRHDFRSLDGMKLAWTLRRNGEAVRNGEIRLTAESRATENIRIPVTIPADASDDVLALYVRCLDEDGMRINERSIRLDLADAGRGSWADNLPARDTKVSESGTEVRVETPGWSLVINRADGALVIRDTSGRTLVSGIHPHAGRMLTMAEALDAKKAGTWREASALVPESCDVRVTRDGDAVGIRVEGIYPRPSGDQPVDDVDRSDDPLFAGQQAVTAEANRGEALVGAYQMEISPAGAIHIRYEYRPRDATGRFGEAGLAVALPAEATEFRWIGQGIHPGYPGKDRLNEFGIYHLTRDDLRFQGNRRETEVALLTTPDGSGVSLTCEPADVAVERHGDETLLSHNALISGLGNKGVSPETKVSAAKTERIAGGFTLVPLRNEWPAPLVRWFGEPKAASDVLKPFHHSYDQ